MLKKTTLNQGTLSVLLLLLPLLYSPSVNAQCAGSDASVSNCSKGNNQFVDLFAALGGTPQSGGTWSSNDQDNGLDAATGRLDTYEIVTGGVFEYTYTINGDASCTDNTAVVTLTLGSYAGKDNSNAVVCADTELINLFQFSGGNPSPTIDGTWETLTLPDDVLSGANNKFLDVSDVSPGRYDFMYTVPAYGACPATTSSVVLEVAKTSDSGTSSEPAFCESADLSPFTSYNLRDALIGADPNGTWSETSTTNEISNPGDSRINIERLNNTFGPGTYSFTYTVNPISPTCTVSATTVNILIEDVIDFSSIVINLTLPNDQEDAVCIDALPISVSATLNVDMAIVPDGDYEITYEVRGGANAGTENLTVSFVKGKADFNIDPDFFTATAEVIVEVIQIKDPNTQRNCPVLLNDVTDGFTINPLPDLTDTNIEVSEPICFGEDLNVLLTDINNAAIELKDGTYTITYKLAAQNTDQTATEIITVTDGNATFTVPANLLESAGAATLTINKITAGNGCTIQADLSDSFTVTPRPDAAGLTVNIPATCEGEPVVVNLTSGGDAIIADGNYSIRYSLSGASPANDQSIDPLVFTDGTATFNIPPAMLNMGTSNIVIKGLQNTSTGCDATNLNDPSGTFSIAAFPDLSASNLTIVSVCEAQQVSLTIEDNSTAIPDGEYILEYTLTLDGTSSNHSTTTAFTDGNGTVDFLAETVSNPGSYTFSLDSFENSSQSCPATGLPRETSFDVFKKPELAGAALIIAPVCFGEPVVANLSGADLEDGDFQLSYTIGGVNAGDTKTLTATFTAGATSFIVPEGLLTNTGQNSLTINTIIKENGTINCSTDTALTTDFSINAQPVFDDVALSLETELCLGDAATVNVTSANGEITDGDYTLIYTLAGDNSAGNQVQKLTIASGAGSLIVPMAQLANAGNTQLTVNRVTNDATGCFTDPANLSLNFTIALPPDLNNATLAIPDFCAASGNQNVKVNAPDLDDGTYSFTYNLAGINTRTETASGIEFVNGIGSFELPETLIGNTDATTVTVTAVASETCRTENLAISTTFEVFPLPQLAVENLAVASVCLGEDTVFAISGSTLEDGEYDLMYSLSGANTWATQATTINIVNGSADLIIEAQRIDQVGTTTLTVESLQNNGTTCQSTSAVATTFKIHPIPAVDQANISAMDICFGEAGMLSFNNASALADGTYTATYSLSGTNSSIATTETFTINNAKGFLEIPADQLSAIGNTTITLTQIVSENGCTSGAIDIRASFEIQPRPDAAGLSINVADICLATAATVNVSGAVNLTDGEYMMTYQLGNANEQTQTDKIIFTAGEARFTIAPALLLNSGDTSIRIVQLSDFINQCGAINLENTITNFAVDDPEPPSLMSNGNAFCINDNPTVADLISRLTPAKGITVYGSESGNDALDPTSKLVNASTYYASQTNAMGCEGILRLAISVDLTDCDNIFIPEAFSPNGDGMNDRFSIENIDIVYPDYTIEIFNRNGNAVYKGNATSEAWDGTANQHQLGDKVLPNGVYFYIINYNNGETAPIQGNLYLNR